VREPASGVDEPVNPDIRLMPYNWQLPDWPEFRYELDGVADQRLV